MNSRVPQNTPNFGNFEAVRFFRTLGGNGLGHLGRKGRSEATRDASLRERIKSDLAKNGLKMKDLAEFLNVRLSALSDYLAGRRHKVSRREARKIRDYLIENGYIRVRRRRKLGEILMLSWSIGAQLESIVKAANEHSRGA